MASYLVVGDLGKDPSKPSSWIEIVQFCHSIRVQVMAMVVGSFQPLAAFCTKVRFSGRN